MKTNTTKSNLISLLLASNDAGTNFANLVARGTLAVVMFPHGAQKLLGWFGGYGFSGTMGFFTETMGIPWILAFGVIMVEFFGPILLTLGLLVRPTAIALGTVMTVAMLTVHIEHGFFMNWFGNQEGEGIEYFLLYIGGALAVAIHGGGRLALDHILMTHLKR